MRWRGVKTEGGEREGDKERGWKREGEKERGGKRGLKIGEEERWKGMATRKRRGEREKLIEGRKEERYGGRERKM